MSGHPDKYTLVLFWLSLNPVSLATATKADNTLLIQNSKRQADVAFFVEQGRAGTHGMI